MNLRGLKIDFDPLHASDFNTPHAGVQHQFQDISRIAPRFHVTRDQAPSADRGTEAEAVAAALGLPTLYDEPGDALGPLAGVKVGLIWAEKTGASTLAVSPCDAPLLPDDLYRRLFAEAQGGAAMAETSDGRQPLCALWPVTALPIVREALAGGAHPPTWQVLERLGARKVRFEPAAAFANINTRDDLAAIAAKRR